MVVTGRSSDGSQIRIMARGNFSLDAGGLASLLLALAFVTLGLAALLAWQGYWPVLLIAMIQIILVVWTLVRAWERCWVVECIDVGPEQIEVTKYQCKGEHPVLRIFEMGFIITRFFPAKNQGGPDRPV